MGLDGTLYKTLLVLHIMAAIVGFGAVFLNGLYAAETKKRQGPSGRAVLEANIAVSSVAEKLIYAVPLLGTSLGWRDGRPTAVRRRARPLDGGDRSPPPLAGGRGPRRDRSG